MLPLTRWPSNVRYFLRGTQQFFHFRPHLVFSWTLVFHGNLFPVVSK